MAKISVQGLSKIYGAVTALYPTDIEMQAGEFLTLLGPSGSGKTTVLQMICGLVKPESGRVIIDGRDVTDTPPRDRGLGLVFQNYALFPHMTVAENIGFPLEMRGIRGEERKRRIRQTAELVQLDKLVDRYPAELSGGQQQRVALARCFVYEPSIILMDEPLGALDKNLREQMQIEIRRLHRETRATIIYVTHDQEEALTLSDRICLMNHARVEQIAPPRRIYTNPATVFAARFIGLSNLIPAKLLGHESNRSRLETPMGEVLGPASDEAAGAQFTLLLRPEQMVLAGSTENNFRGKVTEMVFVGPEARVMVDARLEEDLVIRVPAKVEDISLGQEVSFGWGAGSGVLLS